MSLKHAVLGFLSVTPMSGYDLRKHMQESVAHFWPADQAQIYRSLTQLIADDLVDVTVIEQDGKPNRREHRIKPQGVEELNRWLRSPCPYESNREPFLLRIFFVGRLGKTEVLRLIGEREAEAREMVMILTEVERVASQQLEAIEGCQPTLEDRLRLATIRNGVRHAEAEIKWLDDVRDLTLSKEGEG